MKAIVKTYLNKRLEKPSITASVIDYFSPGDEINVIDKISGDTYKGNNIWYKLDNGIFVWAGGVIIQEESKTELEKTISDFKNQFINIQGVIDVSVVSSNNKSILQIYVNKNFNAKTLIPKKVFPQSLNSTPLDVEIIDSHDIVTHAINLKPSEQISNKNCYPNNSGSLGCFVSLPGRDAKFFITCYHVVKSPLHIWENFQLNGNEIIELIQGNEHTIIGRIIAAKRDDKIDAAIIEFMNGSDIEADIPNIGRPLFFRDLTRDDITFKTTLKMNGLVSNYQEGYCYDIDVPAEIKYLRDGNSGFVEYHILKGLIKIKSLSNTNFSQEGDSGSILVDEYNYVVGMLVAGNNDFSYAIPISNIINQFKFNF